MRLKLVAASLLILAFSLGTHPDDLIPSFQKNSFIGKVQEIAVSDDFLLVHTSQGNAHMVTCVAEPSGTILWQKPYRSFAARPALYLYDDRAAVAGATSDSSKTLGIRIYQARTGEEKAFFSDQVFSATSRYIVSKSGATGEIIDLLSEAKVFSYSWENRVRLKAAIGNKILYLTQGNTRTASVRPMLLDLADLGQSWQGITFSPDVLDFIEHEMDASEKLIFKDFPILISAKPRTRSNTDFKLLFLDYNGISRLFTPADFDIAQPEHSTAVDFCFPWNSGGRKGLAAGINTGHLRSLGARELIIVTLDATGNRTGRIFLSLNENRVLWAGTSPQGDHLILLLHKIKPKSSYQVVSYELPDLRCRFNQELGFLTGTPKSGGVVDGKLFIAGNTGRHEQSVFSLNPDNGSLASFYPFPEKPYFLQTSPDGIFIKTNTRHLFVSMFDRGNPAHTVIYRIPKTTAGWLNGSLSLPSPVYTGATVAVNYSPTYATLSVNAGTLSGKDWKAPDQAGEYTFTLAMGSAVREFPVTVIAPPANQPPIADFRLVEPDDSIFWKNTATFDASASRDPDGKIVKYSWNFGDSLHEEGADKVQINHISAPGSYDVTLTVTDDRGASASRTRTIVYCKSLSYREPWHMNIGAPAALAGDETADYEIKILTGKLEKAGTNAAVYLAMYSPKDPRGMRRCSGEFKLDTNSSNCHPDPFERGRTDCFQSVLSGKGIRRGWNLDEIEYLTLRHNNSNAGAGWYCYGIRIHNIRNGKVWVFVPDQWLAFDEGPKHIVWYKFTPVEEAYPGGIFFCGNEHSRCENMIQASDNVFILKPGITEFYFTMLDGSRHFSISRDGVLINSIKENSNVTLDQNFLRKSEWGIRYQASQITRPTRFEVVLKSGNKRKSGLVWVFPSSWSEHPDLARKAVLTLPFKNNLTMFDYGATAKAFLQGQSVDIQAALSPIVNYGSQALAIFADIPDLTLKGYAEAATKQYLDLRLVTIAAKLGLEFTSELTSSLGKLLTSIKQALEWASEMGNAISAGIAEINSPVLLYNMAGHDTSFLISVEMFQVLKGKMQSLVTAAESNDIWSFQNQLDDIEAIILGETADATVQEINAASGTADFYINYADHGITPTVGNVQSGYPLLLELAFEYRNVKQIWEPGISAAPYFLDIGSHSGSSFQSLYQAALNRYTEDWLDSDFRIHATVKAMTTYAPIIKDMIKITSLVANIVLLK